VANDQGRGPAAAGSIRVLLVANQGLFREGVRSVLEQTAGLRVVAEAGSLAEARAAIRRAQPEVVLAEYRLPGEEDGAVISGLTRLHPELPVVVLTDVPPEQCLQPALQAGAQGFVMKEAAGDLVLKAIAAVRAGGVWVQREAFTRSVHHARGQITGRTAPKSPLSAREREVLGLLATGASTTEIAKVLFITTSTVRVHVLHVMEKLGAESRISAVRRAIALGLVDP
jgi:DNA-binding NarL/FixJ family response regulator